MARFRSQAHNFLKILLSINIFPIDLFMYIGFNDCLFSSSSSISVFAATRSDINIPKRYLNDNQQQAVSIKDKVYLSHSNDNKYNEGNPVILCNLDQTSGKIVLTGYEVLKEYASTTKGYMNVLDMVIALEGLLGNGLLGDNVLRGFSTQIILSRNPNFTIKDQKLFLHFKSKEFFKAMHFSKNSLNGTKDWLHDSPFGNFLLKPGVDGGESITQSLNGMLFFLFWAKVWNDDDNPGYMPEMRFLYFQIAILLHNRLQHVNQTQKNQNRQVALRALIHDLDILKSTMFHVLELQKGQLCESSQKHFEDIKQHCFTTTAPADDSIEDLLKAGNAIQKKLQVQPLTINLSATEEEKKSASDFIKKATIATMGTGLAVKIATDKNKDKKAAEAAPEKQPTAVTQRTKNRFHRRRFLN
jgi:hypothetical protein